jgi:hypothetical protein
MAKRRKRFWPVDGVMDAVLADKLVATYDSMSTPSPKPPHRPPNFESVALRLCIMGDYVRLKAYGRRKVVEEIAAHYGVSRWHVIAVIKSDPELRTKLQTRAEDDAALERYLVEQACGT